MLSSSPAAPLLPAHPWHHSLTSTELPPWPGERWLVLAEAQRLVAAEQGMRERNRQRKKSYRARKEALPWIQHGSVVPTRQRTSESRLKQRQ